MPPSHTALPRLMPAALLALLLLAPALPGRAPDDEGPPAAGQPRIFWQFGENARFGLTVLNDNGGRTALTYDEDGDTNHTMVRIDGLDVEFGSDAGRWETREAALGKGPGGKERRGHKSVWVVGKVHVTQTVEVVPSRGGALDACLVRYTVENKDDRPHAVGIRVMIDTQIGENDGNPFALPGKKELITTSADFRTPKEVPAHVRALENADPDNPGFVAHLTLKVGGGLEAPSRFSITTWPGECGWDVPVEDIDEDSAVAIYWNPREVRAGARREVGYAYGRGVVSLGDKGRAQPRRQE